MIPFITRPGLQALPTPYVITKSRIAAFAVRTAEGTIQKLLDDTLNAAAGGRRFEPLLDLMVLAFIHYPDVHAKQEGVPPGECTGCFTYQECAIFLALRDTHGDGPGTCWHVPLLMLNQGIPLILGREVFGFPKVFARVDARPLQMDDWLENPSGTLKVSTEGFPQLGANVPVRFVEVAQAVFKSPHLAIPDLPLRHLPPLDLVGFLAKIVSPDEDHDPLFGFFRQLVSVGFPGIFLKQFPGCGGTKEAAYRQLLKAAFVPTGIGAVTYVLADVTLHDPPTYPVASTFGLAAGSAATCLGIVAEVSWELPPPEDL